MDGKVTARLWRTPTARKASIGQGHPDDLLRQRGLGGRTTPAATLTPAMGTSESIPSPAAAGVSTPRRLLLVLGAVIGAVLLAAMLTLFGLRGARAGTLPGMMVADLEVGSLSEDELRAALTDYGRERGAEPVTATREAPEGDPRAAASFDATAAEVGYVFDAEATADAVLARGRQANPLTALADQLRAFATPIAVEPAEDVQAVTLDAWVTRVAGELRLPPQEGTVRFAGVAVERVDPIQGLQVNVDTLRADAQRAALSPGPDALAIATQPIEAAASAEEVSAAVAQAERAVSAPVTLTRGPDVVTLAPEQLATILRAEPAQGGQGLELRADPAALGTAIGDPSPVDVPAVDASLQFATGVVSVDEGEPGFRVDLEAAAVQVRDLAVGEGPRTAEVAGEEVEPDRTADEVRALGIKEQVSTYTTQHPCCANRVSNIHRIADLIRGVIIEPGQTFSVNEFVGQRTTANGFLADGAIQQGEFVQEVGGGVSQFATTMFNAAYEGGYEIVEHKPHSQYISRYPEGREATLNFPDVDLKVHNNSPHGIYVDTSYTDTSITVSFWSTRWVSVSSVTSARSNFTPPETIVRSNPALAPGQEVVVQEAAGQGFNVTVTRTLSFPDGRTESEDYFTTYVARPRIVERAPG